MSGFAAFVWICYAIGTTYLSAYAVLQGVLWWHHRKQKQPIAPPIPQNWPEVVVQLPIYNEMYVVERLITCICQLDYPKDKLHIQVLDDSEDETTEIAARAIAQMQAAGHQIALIHRTHRIGFKAGALAEATAKIKAPFIAIFDADFLPNADFLQQTIPYLVANDQLACVQTRWGHINARQNLFTRLQALQLNVHFFIEQVGRQTAGVFGQFNGTAGVWRRAAIEDAGNWQHDTLCEDLDLSIRAQLKGWKIQYLSHVVTPAELPARMSDLKSQQFRWMKGGAQCAMKLSQTVVQALRTRTYTRAHLLAHMLSSFVFAASLWTAIWSLLLAWQPMNDIPPQWAFSMTPTMLMLLLVYFSANVIKPRVVKHWTELLYLFPLGVMLFMGLSCINTVAIIEALLGKQSAFMRTPKYGNQTVAAKYKQKMPKGTFVEIYLGIIFLSSTVLEILDQRYTFAPYHLMFGAGMLMVGLASLQRPNKNADHKIM